MKVIKSDTSYLQYHWLFTQLKEKSLPLVIWQITPTEGKRLVCEMQLRSFHLDTNLIHLTIPPGETVLPQLATYGYAEEGQFIFKTTVNKIEGNVLTLQVPFEMQILEMLDATFIQGKNGIELPDFLKVKRLSAQKGSSAKKVLVIKSMRDRSVRDKEFLNNEFTLSLDEEDKIFADQREAPRARPKKDKWVKIRGESSFQVHTLKLFDLSQGGLAFVTSESQLFANGSTIQVIGFDSFDLDDPMVATIMSERPIDESKTEYKVGCKFNDGQE